MSSFAFDHPRYTTRETLGEGAQGRVVRVIDRERPGLALVAKILHSPTVAADPDAATRLAGELALLIRLRAPGLVRVHDFGRDQRGALFLVEDLVDGRDPVDTIANEPNDSAKSARLAKLAIDLAETMSALHRGGFVHGDIKPGNIRVPSQRAQRAVLLDLGAATLSRVPSARSPGAQPATMLTPAFAAPEARAGAPPSIATDIYSLGATLWASTTGAPPTHTTPSSFVRLRDRAPWVPPRVAEIIESMIAAHPADRPASARDVLVALARSEARFALPDRFQSASPDRPGSGAVVASSSSLSSSSSSSSSSTSSSSSSGFANPHCREAEIRSIVEKSALPTRRSHVLYLAGPSGAGKSHLLQEVMLRVLLAGRPVRLIRFGAHDEEPTLTPRFLNYLRVQTENPFPVPPTDQAHEGHAQVGRAPLLLLLDDLHLAPPEIVEALEAFRCAISDDLAGRVDDRPLFMVASLREAPSRGPHTIPIGPLDSEVFAALCRDNEIDPKSNVAREAGGLPGWLFAALGRAPITRDAVVARASTLSESARFLLALVATFGGAAPRSLISKAALDPAGLAECYDAGLLARDGTTIHLVSQHLATDLANALASYAVVDKATELALADRHLPASMLIAVARSSCPPTQRTALLIETARRAKEEEARSTEIEALLALVADRQERTTERLIRLERLTRDAGIARAHPQVLGWIEEAAEHTSDKKIASLAHRRRAEARARAGDLAAARAAADEALSVATSGDSAEEHPSSDEVYALATRGTIALWSADWATAAEYLGRARALADAVLDRGGSRSEEELDREEVARLDHNLGVVSLYRGDAKVAAEAFARSIAIKRALGDRAGVRSCLLNLGLALGRLDRFDEAEAALVEGTALADALGQHGGRAWCLAAHAEIDVKRGRARDAERRVAEAEAIGDDVPKMVRADLILLRGQIALLEGDGRRAIAEVERVDPELRKEDALIDARALGIAARGRLALLPADRRGAARLAIRSIRRARAGDLPDTAREGEEILRDARNRTTRRTVVVMTVGSDATTQNAGLVTGQTKMERSRQMNEGAWGGSPGSLLRLLASTSVAPEEAIHEIAKTIVRATKAERVLVMTAMDDAALEARVGEAWGVDLDGLAIAEAIARVDQGAVRSVLARRGSALSQSLGEEGSRLAIASEERPLVVLVEHRFRARAFDQVSEDALKQWLTLLEVAMRLRAPSIAMPVAAVAVAPLAMSSASEVGASSPSSVPSVPLVPLVPLVRSHSHSDAHAQAQAQAHAHAHAALVGAPSTAMPRREPLREYPNIVGRSAAIRRALSELDAAVETDLPVVVEGETGTGKELFARALHEYGARRSGPFVAVNCAAIADSLFEAELFGHSKGAFTGADRARGGLLARAEHGTLMLDEIGELSMARQATLLRVLEERRYRPVGSDDDRPFDVRIVAATNRDLDRCVEEGTFRRDLLYRLRVLRIVVPPLRDRHGDAEILLRHFLRASSRSRAASSIAITPAAVARLGAYSFPGNVRELLHVAQRLGAAKLERIDVSNLPRDIRAASTRASTSTRMTRTIGSASMSASAGGARKMAKGGEQHVDDLDDRVITAEERAEELAKERERVEQVLSHTSGNISHAASLLGLSRNGLKKRMLRLGLRPKLVGER